jgi:hypothetical protein
MTDELTDAVRRLKELQSDVERLKAARDQEGEPRLFFEASEAAVAIDALSVAGADLSAAEVAVAIDALSVAGADLSAAEVAVASDTQADLRLQRAVENATYGTTGYNTSTYSA